MKVFQRLAHAFKAEGCTATFGMMGDGNMFWLHEMHKLGIKVHEVRHEGAGLGMADGYAQATREGIEAMCLAEELAGLKTETTYTAKALACLIADARSGRLDGAVPVFWQTLNSQPKPPGLGAVDIARLPVDLRRYL